MAKNTDKGQGLRKNEGKNRLDLIPPYPIEQLGKVLTAGADKYADRNWEKGMPWKNVISSLKRHVLAWEKGEDFDPESGLNHMAHVMCNAMFLLEYSKTYPEGDDRPHAYLNRPRIGLDIDEVLADFVGGMMGRFPEMKDRSTYWNDPNISNNFNEIVNDEDFWMNLDCKVGNKGLPFEPHCYITSRPIDVSVTTKWLDKHNLPKAPVYCVGHDESKVDIAKKSGLEWYVDDRYENFVELNKNRVCTFLFDAPHNQRYDVGFKRIKSLNDLITK